MAKEAEMVIVGQAELPFTTKEECLALIKARAERVLSAKKGKTVLVYHLNDPRPLLGGYWDPRNPYSDKYVSLPDGWKQLHGDTLKEAFLEFASQLSADLKSNPAVENGGSGQGYLIETRRYSTSYDGVELVREDMFSGELLMSQDWRLVNKNFVPPKVTLRQRVQEVLFGVRDD